MIEICDDAGSERATIVQEHYLAHCWTDSNRTREFYDSPDEGEVLALKWQDEIPFGFAVYRAEVCALHSERRLGRRLFRLQRRRFLSPGAYGRDYDHWSGSPWSPNSQRVALAEAIDTKYRKFRMCALDCTTGKVDVVREADSILLHHQWSPDASHYLFRDMQTWYLYSWRTRQVLTVYRGESFPKHCYFDRNGEHIVLLDDEYTVKLLACNSLALIATASVKVNLGAKDRIDFSVFDPFESQVLLGINVRFEGIARSERWLAVKLHS